MYIGGRGRCDGVGTGFTTVHFWFCGHSELHTALTTKNKNKQLLRTRASNLPYTILGQGSPSLLCHA